MRQRCVVQAIVQQVNPAQMVTKYPEIAKILKDNIYTDIPAQNLPAFVELVERVQKSKITSVALTPERRASTPATPTTTSSASWSRRPSRPRRRRRRRRRRRARPSHARRRRRRRPRRAPRRRPTSTLLTGRAAYALVGDGSLQAHTDKRRPPGRQPGGLRTNDCAVMRCRSLWGDQIALIRADEPRQPAGPWGPG